MADHYRDVTIYVPSLAGIGLARHWFHSASITFEVLSGSPRFIVESKRGTDSKRISKYYRSVLVVYGEGPESVTWDESELSDGRPIRRSRFSAFSRQWFDEVIEASKSAGLQFEFMSV